MRTEYLIFLPGTITDMMEDPPTEEVHGNDNRPCLQYPWLAMGRWRLKHKPKEYDRLSRTEILVNIIAYISASCVHPCHERQ